MAFLPSIVSTAPLSLVSSGNLLRVHLIPLSMSLINILNSTGPRTNPWGTPPITFGALILGYQFLSHIREPSTGHRCVSAILCRGEESPPLACWEWSPFAAQEAVGLLYHKGSLLGHVQFGVHQNAKVLFCKVAFQLVSLLPLLVHTVIPSQVTDLGFLLNFSSSCFLIGC